MMQTLTLSILSTAFSLVNLLILCAQGSAAASISTNKPSTCQFRTANYITHGLPQQCLRTTATVVKVTSSSTSNSSNTPTISTGSQAHRDATTDGETTKAAHYESEDGTILSAVTSSTSTARLSTTMTGTTASADAKQPADEDSPLDTPNFLSFEEWKAQNLANAGQSTENFGGKAASREPRRQPESISAIDALGDDAEIELDFGDSDGPRQGEPPHASVAEKPSETVAPQSHTRSKDAGKTCKERFNYASFDCAATVHKSNPEGKGVSKILVETKDSYMLNQCGAKNKFIIIELCDDILVDTIVLANYEFFSSMFRTFRVSVSDRYPVKSSGWKELGAFEARNSREVQAFLIENPLIWARYLKVEFLTHYGNEYYCPLSLLRVHGTTMMEEFRAQEEAARGEPEDESEEVEPEAVDTSLEVAVKERRLEKEAREEQIQKNLNDGKQPPAEFVSPTKIQVKISDNETFVVPRPTAVPNLQSPNTGRIVNIFCQRTKDGVCLTVNTPTSMATVQHGSVHSSSTGTCQDINSKPKTASDSTTSTVTKSSQITSLISTAIKSTKAASKSLSSGSAASSYPQEQRRQNSTSVEQKKAASSTTSSQSSAPTTQESFFKTIHKRLQLLEANATLSLQYIEEQSRILRDAFSKMEKRQLVRTSGYLEQLNSTVMRELRGFREQYDQLWQSTVIALETQKDMSEREMVAISTRLTILADEVIFQKRMSIIQSVLLVVAIGLVLFSRSPHLNPPIVQSMLSRKSLRLPFESPPRSPSPPLSRKQSRSRQASVQNFVHQNSYRSHHRRTSSDMSSSQLGTPYSPDYEYSPAISTDIGYQEDSTTPMAIQSSPATPSGLNSSEDREITWPQEIGRVRADRLSGSWRPRSPLANGSIENSDDDVEGDEGEEELMEQEKRVGSLNRQSYPPNRPKSANKDIGSPGPSSRDLHEESYGKGVGIPDLAEQADS